MIRRAVETATALRRSPVGITVDQAVNLFHDAAEIIDDLVWLLNFRP